MIREFDDWCMNYTGDAATDASLIEEYKGGIICQEGKGDFFYESKTIPKLWGVTIEELKKKVDEELKRKGLISDNAKEEKIPRDPLAQKQIEIAKKTLRTANPMLGVMGGMTKEEARKILMKYGIKFEDSKMKDDRSDERKYCSHCKKLVEVEGD